jgi:hypothetical protein
MKTEKHTPDCKLQNIISIGISSCTCGVLPKPVWEAKGDKVIIHNHRMGNHPAVIQCHNKAQADLIALAPRMAEALEKAVKHAENFREFPWLQEARAILSELK